MVLEGLEQCGIIQNDEHEAPVRTREERTLEKLGRNNNKKNQKLSFTCSNVRCAWIKNSLKGR